MAWFSEGALSNAGHYGAGLGCGAAGGQFADVPVTLNVRHQTHVNQATKAKVRNVVHCKLSVGGFWFGLEAQHDGGVVGLPPVAAQAATQ